MFHNKYASRRWLNDITTVKTHISMSISSSSSIVLKPCAGSSLSDIFLRSASSDNTD